MSHGLAGEAIRAEPNLTPLLDLVLQLLMFFMICANFVTKQVNENIQLPVMQSARPMDKRERDVLYLNLNADGHLEVLGQAKPLAKANDMRFYLKRQYEDAERLSRESGKGGDVKTMVIIRADKSAEYRDVYQLLDLCKRIGYRRFQMRAMQALESAPK
jgi:biopolymer transport protein ExbD